MRSGSMKALPVSTNQYKAMPDAIDLLSTDL
jgi:hypothetical protein